MSTLEFTEPVVTATVYNAVDPSDWECELFGGGPKGMVWTPNNDAVPCWFWRQMQWLFFGNKWVKSEVCRLNE